MRLRSRSWLLAIWLGACFLWGAISIFDRQFASGEVYPQFSSMRPDRMGTKLLYQSLARLPGITVERNLLPMEFLPRDGATLVLVGENPLQVNSNGNLLLSTADRIAARGNRVLIAMYLDPGKGRPKPNEFEPRERTGSKGGTKKSTARDLPLVETLWAVKIQLDDNEAAEHPLYFARADGWRVRERAGEKILAIERGLGKGSEVLMAESEEFTNESTIKLERLADISGALGPSTRILFDEVHLGVAESGSVVGLARQFRLMGLAFGLGLCATLFIWRNASGFPPAVRVRRPDRFAGRTSHAGLVTLLKRHIPPGELATVCWKEWFSTNRGQVTPEVKAQAEKILAAAAGRPLEATREIQTIVGA